VYLAFAAAIALALGVVSYRRISAALGRRQRLAAPGFSPTLPLVVDSYGDVDAFPDRVKCPFCGKGRLHVLGEGNMTGGSGQLVALKTECLRCEERTTAYFDVSEVPN
jgi:hypothetical protein